MSTDPSATPAEPPTEPAADTPAEPPAPEQAAPEAPAAAAAPPQQEVAPAPAAGAAGGGGNGSGGGGRTPPLPQLVTELRELVVTYVKQQTIIPLRQLGRYVGFGIGGSLLLGFGVVFLSMAGLRALQTETNGAFSDDWSWVPYLIMVVALALGAALVWLFRIARREKEAQ